MAKLSLINRDEKRRGLVKKYAKKRAMLVAIIPMLIFLLMGIRKFGLGRNKLREFAMRGEVPGIVKASW